MMPVERLGLALPRTVRPAHALVALDLDDVTFADDGSGTVLVRHSKADQAGEGAVVYIAPDTVDLVKAWTGARYADAGPLFRRVGKGGWVGDSLSDKAVALVFKRMADVAGLEIDPSGHSTRIGAAQDMTAAGLGTAEIRQAALAPAAHAPTAP